MTINTQDLTEISLTGEGALDVIMRTGTLHLEKEFEENRIKGNDYANVYLQLLQSAMAASISYATQKPLVDQQVLNAVKEGVILDQQAINAVKEGVILDAQAIKLASETAVLNQQVLNAAKEGAVLDAQAAKLTIETSILNLQLARQAEVLQQQLDKGLKEIALLEAQAVLAAAQATVAAEQENKIEAERNLLIQKTATELAQTDSTGLDSSSVIGRQIDLYEAQADGYEYDKDVKKAKIYADIEAVRYSTVDGYTGQEGVVSVLSGVL